MTIFYRDGYKGQLAKTAIFQCPYELHPPNSIYTEFIRLDCLGEMTIRSGYAWDYASGPTFDANWMPGHKKAKTPSLIHDCFCQLIRQGLMDDVQDARKHADKFFYQLLLDRKFWKPRAWLWYRGVRIGAKSNEQKPKPILEAP